MTTKEKFENVAKNWAKRNNPECEQASIEAYKAGIELCMSMFAPIVGDDKIKEVWQEMLG